MRQPSHKMNLKIMGRDSSRGKPVVRESTKRWTKAHVRAVNKPHEIRSSWDTRRRRLTPKDGKAKGAGAARVNGAGA